MGGQFLVVKELEWRGVRRHIPEVGMTLGSWWGELEGKAQGKGREGRTDLERRGSIAAAAATVDCQSLLVKLAGGCLSSTSACRVCLSEDRVFRTTTSAVAAVAALSSALPQSQVVDDG